MKERVSSFIDGELNQSESEHLIGALQEDNDLRAVWSRFNLYSSAMRDELSPALSANFSARVIRALENEPVQFSPAALPASNKLSRSVIGFAVAASLIGIAILIQKPVLQDETVASFPKVAAVTAPSVPANPEDYELIVSNSKNENVRDRINRLLIEHNEYNPASDMTGIWSYSRFVGYSPSPDSN